MSLSASSSPSVRAPSSVLSTDEQRIVQCATVDMSLESQRDFSSSVAYAKQVMMRAPEDQPTPKKRSVSAFGGNECWQHSSFWSRSFAGDGNLAIVLEGIKDMRGTLALPPECGKLKRMPPKFSDTLASKHIEAMKRKNMVDIPLVEELAKSYKQFYYRVYGMASRRISQRKINGAKSGRETMGQAIVTFRQTMMTLRETFRSDVSVMLDKVAQKPNARIIESEEDAKQGIYSALDNRLPPICLSSEFAQPLCQSFVPKSECSPENEQICYEVPDLDPEVMFAFTGVSFETFVTLLHWYPTESWVLLGALAFARLSMTFRGVAHFIQGTFDHKQRSESHVRKSIEEYLEKVSKVPLSNGESKYYYELKDVPGPTMLVDSFPVRCRSDENAVHGKYYEVARFQCLTDLAGNAIGCQLMTSTIHDDKFYRENGVGVDCVDGECVIGDHAYIGFKEDSRTSTHPPILTAIKQSNTKSPSMISDRVNTYLQIARSPIERLFSRLHMWGIRKGSMTNVANTANFIRLILLADTIQNPQRPNPNFVRTKMEPSRPTKPQKENAYEQAITGIKSVVANPALSLRSKNSMSRAKGAPVFKHSNVEFDQQAENNSTPDGSFVE